MKIRSWMTGSLLALAAAALAQPALAEGDCAITYTRTACPGQEAESYKKCEGEKTCTKSVEASSQEQCATAAVDACANDRLTVTESKIITAKFKGQDLKS